MILIIDNFDSFVFNLARYVTELGEEARVVRNDAIDPAGVADLAPQAIILSPGPGGPDDAGQSMPILRALAHRIPILGVCLGHQCIGAAFGGRVARAREPMHGRASAIHHDGAGVFAGLPTPFGAGRYHSLAVEVDGAGPLQVSARSERGEVMGLTHRAMPVHGVQFHPESILSEHGHALLANFLRLAKEHGS